MGLSGTSQTVQWDGTGGGGVGCRDTAWVYRVHPKMNHFVRNGTMGIQSMYGMSDGKKGFPKSHWTFEGNPGQHTNVQHCHQMSKGILGFPNRCKCWTPWDVLCMYFYFHCSCSTCIPSHCTIYDLWYSLGCTV